MLEYIKSWFVERRNGHRRIVCLGCDRRRVSKKEADLRLAKSIDDFATTVTLSPEKVKELLERAKK